MSEGTLRTTPPSGVEASVQAPPSGSGGERRRWGAAKKAVRDRLVWIPLGILAAWTLIPMLMAVSVALKQPTQVFSEPGLIPADPSLDAFRRTLAAEGFQRSFMNSVLLAVGVLVITLLVSVPAAYAFARFRFKVRHVLLVMILLPRLVPSLGLMVPLFHLGSRLGLLNSRAYLSFVLAGTLAPLATWLMTGFFQQIPREIEDAAAVDGANLWSRLWLIVLPLSIPALITVGALAFREAWNEFDLVLALTTDATIRTLPYELFLLQDLRGVADYPAEAAFALLTLLPLLLLYLRLERYVVQGITAGSMK